MDHEIADFSKQIVITVGAIAVAWLMRGRAASSQPMSASKDLKAVADQFSSGAESVGGLSAKVEEAARRMERFEGRMDTVANDVAMLKGTVEERGKNTEHQLNGIRQIVYGIARQMGIPVPPPKAEGDPDGN
jgi:hypothetical protein